MTEQSKTEQLPQCKCGFTREDIDTSVYVTAKNDYSSIGWFLILFGITATPKSVTFRCTQCSHNIETNTNPKLLKRFA